MICRVKGGEKVQNQAILYGIIGLLLGVIITGFVASNVVNSNNVGMMRMMGMNPGMMAGVERAEGRDMMDEMMGESMGGMVGSLKGKSGEGFDKEFIAEMIIHHQGAIDMANLAKINAKHQEIKDLADDIISAQTSEIDQMKKWQSSWGY